MADVVLEMAILLAVVVVILAIAYILVAEKKSPAALRKQPPARLTRRRRAGTRSTGMSRLAVHRTPSRRRSVRLHNLGRRMRARENGPSLTSIVAGSLSDLAARSNPSCPETPRKGGSGRRKDAGRRP